MASFAFFTLTEILLVVPSPSATTFVFVVKYTNPASSSAEFPVK